MELNGTTMSIPAIPITEREFDIYALSLPRGPNFDPLVVHSAWKARSGRSVGAVLFDSQKQDFGIVILSRKSVSSPSNRLRPSTGSNALVRK